MISLVIPFDGFQITVNVPVEDIVHYCGPSYHIGWLAGLGYVATSVQGHVRRLGEEIPINTSASVAQGDLYEFIYKLGSCRPIDLSNVSANGGTSSSSSSDTRENAQQGTANVANRDPFCVFSGIEAGCVTRITHILPVKVHTKHSFHLLRERLGLCDIGELANLLNLSAPVHDALDKQRKAAILATDDRFVPLQYMLSQQGPEVGLNAVQRQRLNPDIPTRLGTVDEPTFRLYLQYMVIRDINGQSVRNDCEYVLGASTAPLYAPHQCAARFAAGAFAHPDDAPAREVYHYVYWGTMLLQYLDSHSITILKDNTPDDPPTPRPELDGGSAEYDTTHDPDDNVDDLSGHPPNPALSTARYDFRRQAKTTGQAKTVGRAPSGSEEIFDVLLAMNRWALLPVKRAEEARKKDEMNLAVRAWQAGIP